MKTCTKCGHTKPEFDFSPGTKGLKSWCKRCCANDQKERNKRNPEQKSIRDKEYRSKNRQRLNFKDRERYYSDKEKFRERNLMSYHGITQETYGDMFEIQNGVCSICGLTATESSHFREHLSVDHNHQSMAIRGLLCNRCNLAVGYLKDSVVLALKAACYLLKSEEAVEHYAKYEQISESEKAAIQKFMSKQISSYDFMEEFKNFESEICNDDQN